MAPSQAFNSAATITTTARSMPSDTTTGVPVSRADDGYYELSLDVSALALGDEYLVRFYEKAQAADTQRSMERFALLGPQTAPILRFPALMLMHGWDMTIVKVAGTDRSVEWSIRSYGTPAEYFAASETVTTTEHSLTTDTAGPDAATDDKAIQALIDVSALATGDRYQLRGYEKIGDGTDTQRKAWERVLAGAQPDPLIVVPVAAYLHGWDLTLDKLAGTDRSVSWSLRSIG